MLTLAKQTLDTARKSGMTIATAESCTGGMVSAALTEIPGSSDVFLAGFVTYSNFAKQAMIGVSAETLHKFGAVSEEVAAEMVKGALSVSGANLAVSITGIAGPGGSEHKPEGRVCFGLLLKDQAATTQTIEFGAIGRKEVRISAAKHALTLLKRAAT